MRSGPGSTAPAQGTRADADTTDALPPTHSVLGGALAPDRHLAQQTVRAFVAWFCERPRRLGGALRDR